MFGNGSYSRAIYVNCANKPIAPPQLSPAELKAQEDEATLTIQKVIVGAVLLYLSPFAIDTLTKLV
ncbi:hypothetical protein LSUE1_G005757 [Lachnellula suecica]|uniref:Mitochondrial outer membrane translocase complex, subunit Tom5 n=1 Tax=Lachnellula suecica TaxID=602035 RepID=A0A8T9C9G9_9HELO|nr:hypothetical protein LSUE1_G005757 [Lachnellula suecica]